jgi:hypothetical protein
MPQQIDGYPSKPHKQANELRAQKAKVKQDGKGKPFPSFSFLIGRPRKDKENGEVRLTSETLSAILILTCGLG